MNSAVGSFTKSTGAAPVSQTGASGLAFAPTVVFLWTSGVNTTQDAWAVSSRFAFGFADANEGRSVGFATEDAAPSSNASRRMANKALSIVEWGESLLAECDLTLTSDGFSVNWTTNNAVAYHINYLALDVANVEIVDWDHNTTGNKSVTGAGFTPEMVIHLSATAQAATTTESTASFMLGAMTSAAQWGMYVGDADAQNTMVNTGVTITDGCIARQVLTSMAIDIKAAYSSMDADGFTVNFSLLGSQRFFSSLCLADSTDSFAVGTEVKTTGAATATDTISGLSFEPIAVLAAINANCVTSGTGTQHARFGIGASDGTNERAVAVSAQDNIGTSVVDSYSASAKAVVKNNNTTPAIDAQADIAMTSDGFTLSWTTNDAVATLVPWIAFGPEDAGGTPGTLTVTAATAPAAGEAVTLDAASNLTVTAAPAPAAGGNGALIGAAMLTVTAAPSPAAGGDVTLDAAATLTVTAATAPAAGEAVNLAAAQAATLEVTTATAPAAGGDVTFDAAALFTIDAAPAPAAGGNVNLTGEADIPGTLSVTTAEAPAAGGTVAFTAASVLTVTTATAPADGGAVILDADVAASLTVTAATATAAADGDLFAGIVFDAFAFDLATTMADMTLDVAIADIDMDTAMADMLLTALAGD